MTIEERREYEKGTYWMLKRNHRCTKCRKKDAYTLAGHSRCFECNEKRRKTPTDFTPKEKKRKQKNPRVPGGTLFAVQQKRAYGRIQALSDLPRKGVKGFRNRSAEIKRNGTLQEEERQMAQNNKWETLTIDQMSRANAIVQRLVKDCVNAWTGKRNGHTAFDTYNRVEEIHAILHEDKGNEGDD